MQIKMTDEIISPQDLKSIILELRQYNIWFTQNSVKLQVSKSSITDQPIISDSAIKLLKDYTGNKASINQKDIDGLLKSLAMLGESSPSLTMTLAAAPSNGLKKQLISWYRENIDPNILVDFRFNSTLLGGMVIKYQSHVYDYSFRRQILAAKEKFPEVLRRV